MKGRGLVLLAPWLGLLIAAALFAQPGAMAQTAGANSFDSQSDVVFSFDVRPAMLPADGKTEATIVLKLTDANGAPLAGRRVSFYLEDGYGRLTTTFPNTDDKGTAEALYVAGRTAKTAVVRATDEISGKSARIAIPTSISAQIQLELVEPSRFISTWIKRQTATQLYTMDVEIFPERLVADGFSTSRITVRLYNLDGTYASGVPIVIRMISGDGELIRDRQTTDTNGVLEAFYRAGERPGTTIIEVTEPVTGLTQTVEIPILEAGPAKIKLYFSNRDGRLFEEAAKLPADGITSITIVAQVLNLVDTPVPNVDVMFSLAEELGAIEVLESTTDPEGKVYATFKPGTQTGIETITAFLVSSLPQEFAGGVS
ncbi:MAG: Ig-like domain-containing protein [bacterium]|jgi:hypothetical protein